MNIAVDVMSIRVDGSAGGATGFAIELIRGFAAREDVNVFVLCADWNIAYLGEILPKNVTLCQMTGKRFNCRIGIVDRVLNYADSIMNKDILKKHHIDILFCPFSAATYRCDGIPTVSTILDIQHEYYPQFFSATELRTRKNFYRDIVENVEWVVCISDYTKKTFCEKYGFPIERANTIYIAVQNRFSEEDTSILKKLEVKKEEYLVFSANFWEHKNHKMLLIAYSMYVNNGGTLKLVLTGNPLEEQAFYDDMIKKLGLEGKVLITGYVSEKELYAILNNSKGIIYPSLFEGFGIPVVEAMHMHKLIASSNMTSLPEIGCEAIHYFDPRKPDEILKGIEYIDKNSMTEEIVSEYNSKLKEYEPEAMIQQYMNVFKDIIENKGKYSGGVCLQERVTGIYEDGWAGKKVVVRQSGRQGCKVRIKLNQPKYVRRIIKMMVVSGEKREQITLRRGKSIEHEIDITDENAKLEFVFSTAWKPRRGFKVVDDRALSVIVEDLRRIDKAGNSISLISEEMK